MIRPTQKKNYETLLSAAKSGRLLLMECTDAATGEPRDVICAVNAIGGEYEMVPLAVMVWGDPYEMYVPPISSEVTAPSREVH